MNISMFGDGNCDRLFLMIIYYLSNSIRNPDSKLTAEAIDERADILFQVGINEHSIHYYTSADLPESELDWLAYEISSFWELPITYQSPPLT